MRNLLTPAFSHISEFHVETSKRRETEIAYYCLSYFPRLLSIVISIIRKYCDAFLRKGSLHTFPSVKL
jgi:hypothetical protein